VILFPELSQVSAILAATGSVIAPITIGISVVTWAAACAIGVEIA